MECICQCTVAYTGWPPVVYSAGKRYYSYPRVACAPDVCFHQLVSVVWSTLSRVVTVTCEVQFENKALLSSAGPSVFNSLVISSVTPPRHTHTHHHHHYHPFFFLLSVCCWFLCVLCLFVCLSLLLPSLLFVIVVVVFFVVEKNLLCYCCCCVVVFCCWKESELDSILRGTPKLSEPQIFIGERCWYCRKAFIIIISAVSSSGSNRRSSISWLTHLHVGR